MGSLGISGKSRAMLTGRRFRIMERSSFVGEDVFFAPERCFQAWRTSFWSIFWLNAGE